MKVFRSWNFSFISYKVFESVGEAKGSKHNSEKRSKVHLQKKNCRWPRSLKNRKTSLGYSDLCQKLCIVQCSHSEEKNQKVQKSVKSVCVCYISYACAISIMPSNSTWNSLNSTSFSRSNFLFSSSTMRLWYPSQICFNCTKIQKNE